MLAVLIATAVNPVVVMDVGHAATNPAPAVGEHVTVGATVKACENVTDAVPSNNDPYELLEVTLVVDICASVATNVVVLALFSVVVRLLYVFLPILLLVLDDVVAIPPGVPPVPG
jgi:hypothetical protein